MQNDPVRLFTGGGISGTEQSKDQTDVLHILAGCELQLHALYIGTDHLKTIILRFYCRVLRLVKAFATFKECGGFAWCEYGQFVASLHGAVAGFG